MNETMERRFQRVQEAAQLRLSGRMKEREEAILSKLVLAYRSERLSHEMLFGGIAAIAELRAIVSDVERDQLRATDEAALATTPHHHLKD